MSRHAGALALGLAVVAAALLTASGPLYRSGTAPLLTAFTLMRWAAYLAVAATVLAVVALIFVRSQRWPAVAALVVGGLVFAIPFMWLRAARAVPAIHDITTDTDNPPTFVAVVPLRANAPNKLEYSQDVARQQREGYPDLGPRVLNMPRDQAFERALAAARSAGWEIVAADQASGRIEATDTTRWFGFKDDVVIRLTPEGNGTRVDVRSVSRVGGSDVGTNARRIRQYLDSLEPA
jgi:uncharacterized protein (DUF1499 family)